MKHRFIKTISALFFVMTLLLSSSVLAFADSTDKWVPKAAMSTDRYGHQTVVLNGKIYAMGGLTGNQILLASVEEYDPDTDKWTSKASMKEARANFQTAVINNKIYAIGGAGNKGELSSVEEYDPENDKWISKASLNDPRREFQAVVYNGKIYAIGGYGFANSSTDKGSTTEQTLKSVEEYDPETDTWTIKAPMSCVRKCLGAALINGKIYAIGGLDSGELTSFQSQIEEYDIQRNVWTPKASLSSNIGGVKTARVINNKIYTIVTHQISGTTFHNEIEEYDPATNVCSEKAPLKNETLSISLEAVNGHLFALGYSNKSTEEYDPQTKTCEQRSNMLCSGGTLLGFCTSVINNTLYAIGGSQCSDTSIYTTSFANPSLTVAASPNKVKIGQQFTTDIAINNETNICAEDIKLTYDKNLFEYEGATGQTGTKIYKEDTSTPGTIRFITACQGKDNAATGDKGLITLKFKAKAKGVGKVDIIKGRIADNATLEEDVADENCGEDTITVDGYQDVNRSGNFTLLDLGIDAYYDGMNASDTDSTKYDADVIPDGKIDDNDLAQITQEILANKDYAPNNY